MLAKSGNHLLRAAVVCALGQLAVAANLAQAVPMNYGDFAGANVMFLDVTEDSATDPTPLYGAPTVSGNGLSFSPLSSFAASSSDGTADITDGKLTTFIMSNTPSFGILGLSLSEFGDYTLEGTGTAATNASVGAPVFLNLLAVDGVGVTPQQLFAGNLTMSPANGSFDLVNDQGIGVPWSGVLTIDVQAALESLGYSSSQHATKVAFQMDNTLTATSEQGTIAFIAKKGVNGPSITVLPEPATWALSLIGLVGLAFAKLGRR